MIEENNRQLGGLHRSFGELAEHLVAPGIAKRFEELGYRFRVIAHSKYGPYDGYKVIEKGNVLTEIDIMLEDDDYIIAVEVKSRPVLKDIEHHIKRLEILREAKDEFGDNKRKIRGAMAGAVFPQEAKKAAIEAGFYVVVQSGDTMKIEIPESFVPREW
jgi:predicted AAA+ superfamily ATPase